MPTELTFSDTDFFYNNVNAPLKFDPALCTLSDAELTAKVTAALNLPKDISAGVVPKTDQEAGQCTWRRATADDNGLDNKFKATSWKLVFTTDQNGNQQCNCVKKDPVEYIPYDAYTIKTATSLIGSDLKPYAGVNYVCKDSIPVKITDTKINDIHLDASNREKIISSSVNYYKSVCQNKDKAAALLETNSLNIDSDLKYEDVKEFYNREYLNRINLGIGIIATCGFIYFTVMSGNQILPSSPV